MSKIFISGSMNIKNINPMIIKRINNMIESNFDILIGDANGSDKSIQEILKVKEYKNVTVYCSGNYPRNNLGSWKLNCVETEHKPNTRSFFTAKDLEMAKTCDYGLMIWDSKSTGTLSNVYELLRQGKTSIVFINKLKQFFKVSNITEFQKMISIMSEGSLMKANKKIDLDYKIRKMKHVQLHMFDAPSL